MKKSRLYLLPLVLSPFLFEGGCVCSCRAFWRRRCFDFYYPSFTTGFMMQLRLIPHEKKRFLCSLDSSATSPFRSK